MNEQSKRGVMAAPLGGVLVLAVLAVPAWLAFGGNSEPATQPAVLSLRESSLQARWPSGTPAPERVVMPPLPAASAAVKAEPDTCGGFLSEKGRTRSPGSESQAAEALRARERLGAALLVSPDEVSRAAGHVLRRLEGTQPTEDHPVCEGARCAIAAAEHPEAAAAARKRRTGELEPLARLALHTRSAEVYAIAWQSCRHDGEGDPGGACRMLSADQWAWLEPDNAVPWLEVAALAQQRGDQAALSEAMFRVSKARVLDTRTGQLAHTVFKRLPAGTPLRAALAVAGDLGRVDFAWNKQRYQVPLAYCSVERVADVNLHQRCNEIAELLLSRGRVLQELSVASQLGERLGWPTARLEAIHLQRDAMTQAMMTQEAKGIDSPNDCVALRRKTERLRELAEKGERGVALVAMQRIGKTEAELARQYREGRVRLAALSPAAASAPRP